MNRGGSVLEGQQELTSVRRLRESRLREGGPGSGRHKGPASGSKRRDPRGDLQSRGNHGTAKDHGAQVVAAAQKLKSFFEDHPKIVSLAQQAEKIGEKMKSQGVPSLGSSDKLNSIADALDKHAQKFFFSDNKSTSSKGKALGDMIKPIQNAGSIWSERDY